jgi:hypothetical protein
MSLYYQHILVPLTKESCPTPDSVIDFLQGVVDDGGVGKDFQVTFERITIRASRAREVRNPFTGETFKIKQQSRYCKEPEPLSTLSI